MLTIGNLKEMSLRALIIFCLYFLYLLPSNAAQETIDNIQIEQNIAHVNALFLANKENLHNEEIIPLSNNIIQNRALYTTDVIAKTYVLLADLATKKADTSKAFQFATDGLTLTSLSPSLKLNLLQKLANGYYANGRHLKTIDVVNTSIVIAKEHNQLKYLLIALSYRAMAHALTANYQEANADLQEVENLIDKNPQFSNHLELLKILAIAHHYLGDYQFAITMQNKIIAIKLSESSLYNISQAYYQLAINYEALNKFDDAFSAFWEAEMSVNVISTPIRMGYIQLGFGKMLLKQQQFLLAYQKLKLAENLFIGKNQIKPYLSTLISLAKAAKAIGKNAEERRALLTAEQLTTGNELSEPQIDLYQQLHLMYAQENKLDKALFFLNKYITEYQRFHPSNKINKARSPSHKNTKEQSKKLAGKLGDEAKIQARGSQNKPQQQQFTTLLAFSILILILLCIVLWLRRKTLLLTKAYNDNEKPSHFLYNSSQIKHLYQLNYKKSRKYEYPISFAFITITNWRELVARVNKRVCNEVTKEIAILINNTIGEFDEVGQLSEGQYLLICPHQTKKSLLKKLNKLEEAFAVSFFANLGDFSIALDYAYDTPSIQDIDPYIFLSRLSEQVNAKYLNE